MLKAEWPDSLDLLWADLEVHPLELRQGAFDVACISEDDGGHDKTQSSELVFLTLTVALPQYCGAGTTVQA